MTDNEEYQGYYLEITSFIPQLRILKGKLFITIDKAWEVKSYTIIKSKIKEFYGTKQFHSNF